ILQFLVYEELKDYVQLMGSKNGSVLICDPDTGDILVMANYPDFDPNKTDSFIQEHTKNRIITDAYEYGSVIKGFLALAAL
ncbi:penicillin-binding transpeptidase domain-containing protein, partial [Klebsiella pneumoniae]|nr:penicillin-binding transpeptidase domain-containing protein [Klebsiella pneumoniae]